MPRLSRIVSAATAAYGVYALARPRHLGRAVREVPEEQASYDLLARAFGVRDLAISAVGVLARSDEAVDAAMLVRIGCDVGDGALLALDARTDDVRTKVLAVTLGWGAVNACALWVDARRR